VDASIRDQFRQALLANGYVVREGDSFRHALEIVKPFGELEHVVNWCKSECQEDWRWQLIDMANDRDPGRYIFYFDSDRDVLAFTMKWS